MLQLERKRNLVITNKNFVAVRIFSRCFYRSHPDCTTPLRECSSKERYGSLPRVCRCTNKIHFLLALLVSSQVPVPRGQSVFGNFMTVNRTLGTVPSMAWRPWLKKLPSATEGTCRAPIWEYFGRTQRNRMWFHLGDRARFVFSIRDENQLYCRVTTCLLIKTLVCCFNMALIFRLRTFLSGLFKGLFLT
jgi:hypothetical protein